MSQRAFEPSPKLVALVEAMKQQTRQQEARLKPSRSLPTAPTLQAVSLRHIALGFAPWVTQASRNAFQQVEYIVNIPETIVLPQGLTLPLQTILTHLLQNALTHGIEPTRDRTRGGKSPISRLTLTATVSEGDLVVTLSDDGRGLPELFTAIPASAQTGPPLTFTSRVAETSIFAVPSGATGLGVGLHIVRSLAQKFSGDVRFRSLPNLGTTVIVQLPYNASA